MHLKLLNRALLSFVTIFTISAFSQSGQSSLDQSFLEGLPQSIREQVEVRNEFDKEEELNKLFRTETSFEKNKVILKRLKAELMALDRELNPDSFADDAEDLSRYGESFFRTLQSSFMPINLPNLGGDYIVDVGDTFEILMTGKLEFRDNILIARDGSISIEGIGKINVAGKTLRDAEQAIIQYIQTAAFGVDAFVSLSKLRDVQVLMLGHVVSPGIFTLSGGSNSLAAINVAGGISDRGSYRKIEHRRNDKLIETIDLYDLMVLGKYQNSNVLRSGDTIFVHPAAKQIPISGGVNYPAIYEVLPGETLDQLIVFASNFSEYYSGFNNLLVHRMSPTASTIVDVSKNDLSSFILESRDSVQVPSYKNKIQPVRKVIIEGMVNRPGEYVVQPNEKLSDLIKQAGGYKENAYVYGAALFREEALKKEKFYAQLNYSDTLNYIISNIGKANGSVTSSVSELLVEELRSKAYEGRVVANFDLNQIENNPDLDVRLFDKDKIIIPEIQKVVYLFGDFRKPSNYTYDPSFLPKDYIALAGGLKKSAYDEILIIDPDGKTHVHKNTLLSSLNSTDVYPGSIIYAQRNIGKLSGLSYASAVSPILSSLAISLASLNSITNDR